MSISRAGLASMSPALTPLVGALVLAFGTVGAQAQSLSEVVQAARGVDATYLGARSSADAAHWKYEEARALHLPSANATVVGSRQTSDTPYQPSQTSGATNVSVVQADGVHGYAAEAPFDAIMLSGSVSKVPDDLLKQLKPGGRLVAIEGDEPVMEAVRYTANADGTFSRVALFDLNATRLLGFPEPARFHF